jgi:hypothetical protein
MKYKVGDKVKVRDDLVVGNCYSYYAYCGDMVNFKGKTVTIKSVAYDFYRIEEDRQTSCWADGMFEDVEDDEAEIAKFRAFLEEVADYRSDEYMEQYLRLSYIMGIGEVDDDEKMDEAVNKLCDFYKTFTPTKETKKKMTKAEIEDALGYKIEIVEE